MGESLSKENWKLVFGRQEVSPEEAQQLLRPKPPIPTAAVFPELPAGSPTPFIRFKDLNDGPDNQYENPPKPAVEIGLKWSF